MYYWPGMLNAVTTCIKDCSVCARMAPSQSKNPRSTPRPSTYFGAPMKHVGLDLLAYGGKTFLTAVDHWSGYPLYCHLKSTTASAVIAVISGWFNTLGWPRSIRSDNGPQFLGQFKEFCRQNNIVHEESSPYNPPANGLAEAGVKIIKSK